MDTCQSEYQDNSIFGQNGGIGRKRRRLPLLENNNNHSWPGSEGKAEEQNNFLTPNIPQENYSRTFLRFDRNSGVYQTDNLNESKDGPTLYLPINGELFLNVKKADEITFSEGRFFIGDQGGRYLDSAEGTVMNIWRYSDVKHQMVVGRSFLITKPAELSKIRFHIMAQ